MKKKKKEGEVLEDSNLPVNFSCDSSSEHEIASVGKTKKKKRKEIPKDSNLPVSKKKLRRRWRRSQRLPFVSTVNFLSLPNS